MAFNWKLNYFGKVAIGYVICWIVVMIILLSAGGYSTMVSDFQNRESHILGELTFGFGWIGGIITTFICIAVLSIPGVFLEEKDEKTE